MLSLSEPSLPAGIHETVCKQKPVLTHKEIIYSVINDLQSCLTLNHLILIGKYFLDMNALKDKRFQFLLRW